ncbi:Fusaric acid resistance protein conserved region [Methylocella silvestris BL2]|uniref:Fusaric acid resistance protein conserved region n=1 Tax=Methylocella silvestris (strain DSM 15510 / CIP 108128 / LMG 27833 / NCIMB 13906 / BL2) TaxID=395965 RepID=B8ES34_METSB|nr:FUSC family protein [Methylocella silvestris]ACK52249.1 Fusaric acid resistance protein conserved region [Methylocella silvestris BL2]
MTPYTVRDWLFALKTFAAAAAALYLCFWLQLQRPYWAVATVYICSQQLSGATRSKAFYRACGTVLGAAMSVALVPNLVNAPELLSLAIALWIACCLYFSLLDRTPRGYMFILAGYTAALIGFPSVDAPGMIFDVAVARVEEILVGIACATVFSTVFFPRQVGPLAAGRLKAWFTDADLWACDALEARIGDDVLSARRLRLAADATQLDALSIHLAFDASIQSYAARAIRLLRLRLLMLLPVISSIEERMRTIAGGGRLALAETQALVDSICATLRDDADISAEQEAQTDDLIAAYERRLDAGSCAREIVEAGLLLRLRDFVNIRRDCRLLCGQIETGARQLKRPLAFQSPAGVVDARHRDRFGAAVSALTAFVCVGGVCLFWIATAWPDGATAAMIAAIVCCIFASQADPAAVLRAFAVWSVVAVGVTMLYLFAILPRIQTFEMLVIALSPAFILFGLLATRPKTAEASVALSLWTATLLALQDNYSADFSAVANSGAALLAGIWISTLAFQLMRVTRADWRLRRLVEASRADLASAATGRGKRDRAHFAAIMLDRLGLAASLLASSGAMDATAVALLAELRVGLNIIELRYARHGLPSTAVIKVDAMLIELGRYFRGRSAPPAPRLLALIDDALHAVASSPPGKHRRAALLGAGGVRYTLFATAPEPGAMSVARVLTLDMFFARRVQ